MHTVDTRLIRQGIPRKLRTGADLVYEAALTGKKNSGYSKPPD